MFAINLLLAHLVSDFAFTNIFSEKLTKKDNTLYHIIWVIIAFLAFTFDSLGSMTSILIISLSIIFHVVWDLYRIKVNSTPLKEFSVILIFFVISFFTKGIFENSYLSLIFQYYLLGLVLVTGLVTYLFRFFKVLPLEKKDTTGMTERMVLFIFLVNQMYLYAIITVIVGITYKYIFEKFRNKEIFFSPIIGFIFSLLWLLLLNNI
ncbi:hypothetical protein [Geotoga petraea]|jgi:hypothetical protein|uniref:DUF3307 domain-containing protein n=1 Tax=Geotoga petraea TaxID=28234 RepID=A0A4Z0VWR7_9BACT|nr:hypothetical protein [Geotoga petraea]TGG85866.1 hypothetical protein E4650_10185 [Geotoga petraea]